MIITNDIYGSIPFLPLHQAGLPGLPAMQTYKATGAYGEIIHQFINTHQYSLHYFSLDINEEVSFHFTPLSQVSIGTILCVRDEMMWRIKDQDLLLGKDRYVIYNGALRVLSLTCRAGSQYRFFMIGYPEVVIRQLREHTPELDEFINKQVSLLATGIRYEGNASNDIVQVVTGVAGARVPRLFQEAWLGHKLSGFLIELLLNVFQQSEPSTKSMILDDICRQAHDFILENISTHFTITQIARNFHINEMYLKTAFKKLYGTGIFEFLQQERLNHARFLLLSTDMPMKEISSIVGFDHMTNFMAAFKNKFKYTPGSLRRKK